MLSNEARAILVKTYEKMPAAKKIADIFSVSLPTVYRLIRQIAAAHQTGVVFLPPYSPEHNPIEKLWANIKRWLRKNTRYYSSFDDALSAAIEFYS